MLLELLQGALLLEDVGLVHHGVGADVGVAERGFDLGDLAGIGGEPALADFELDDVIVREFVGDDAGEHGFDYRGFGAGGRSRSLVGP